MELIEFILLTVVTLGSHFHAAMQPERVPRFPVG